MYGMHMHCATPGLALCTREASTPAAASCYSCYFRLSIPPWMVLPLDTSATSALMISTSRMRGCLCCVCLHCCSSVGIQTPDCLLKDRIGLVPAATGFRSRTEECRQEQIEQQQNSIFERCCREEAQFPGERNRKNPLGIHHNNGTRTCFWVKKKPNVIVL
jgi:hypothetical protein